MTDQRSAYSSLQALRGVAALLVVVFHLRIIETKYGDGTSLLPGLLRFADGGVDLFFVISGFVMATISAGRARSPSSAGMFLGRRLWRIIPLYWIYTTLVVILMAVAPGMVNTSYQAQGVWASYLLWPQAQLPLLTVGWTLIHEMYFYLVMAAAIALLDERWLPAMLLAWGALIVAAQGPLDLPAAPWIQLTTNAMTLEFIGGALLALYWRRIPMAVSRWCLPLGGLAFLAGMLWLERIAHQGADLAAGYPLLRTLVFGPASILMLLGALALEARRPEAVPRWLVRVGDSSYSLYLSHVFVVSAAGRVWQTSGMTGHAWQHAVFIIATIALAMAVARASYRALELPLINMRRQLHPRPATDTRTT